MSRTAAENRAAEESFSRLLDRMTLEGMAPERMPPERLASDRVTLSSGSSNASGRRTSAMLANASNAAPKAVRKVSEPVELSYEKALQRHSRRQPVEEIDLALPTGPAARHASAPASATLAKSTPAKPAPTAVEHAESMPGSQMRRPHTKKATGKAAAGKNVDTRTGANTASRTGPRTGTRPGTLRRGAASRLAAPAKTTLTASGRTVPSRATPAAASKSNPGKRQPAGTVAAAKRQLVAGSLGKDAVALRHPSGTALEPIGEQRRAIISVRLNEDESDRLRQRAAESGISVSAYMRSCMLEAEHLRAQVKAALLEMRASVRPAEAGALAHPEAKRTNREAASGFEPDNWLRLIVRSAALLLAPVFSMRHRM
jgi:hypothetical protein